MAFGSTIAGNLGRNELVASSRGSIASYIHVVPWSTLHGKLLVPILLDGLTTLEALACVVGQPAHPVRQQLTTVAQIGCGNQMLGGREKAGKSAPAHRSSPRPRVRTTLCPHG